MSAITSKLSVDKIQLVIGGALLASLVALAYITSQVATDSTNDKE